MSDPVRKPMTADDFIAWAMGRPEGEHYEFVERDILATASERVSHNRVKGWLYRRFAEAIEMHYLMAKPENRTVIHHRREPTGLIGTRIVRDSSIRLDPPGLEISRLWQIP
jgi:hypothetical protein